MPQKFDELEDLLLNHRRTLAQNTGVPFIRLVYKPDQESECVRRRRTLARTLAQKQVAVQSVSCKGAIYAHYEERGRLERLYQLEQTEPERLRDNIARHARRELQERLERTIERLGRDGVLFVIDTAFVYPYFQLGSVLDAFTNASHSGWLAETISLSTGIGAGRVHQPHHSSSGTGRLLPWRGGRGPKAALSRPAAEWVLSDT